MSLTLSLTPESHVFNDFQCRRSSTLSSSSTGTVRYYGSRQTSESSTINSGQKQCSVALQDISQVSGSPTCCSEALDDSNNIASNNTSTDPQSVASSAIISTPEMVPAAWFQAVQSDVPATDKLGVTSGFRTAHEGLRAVTRKSEVSSFIPEEASPTGSNAFRRWLSTLRRRKNQLGFSNSSPYRPLLSESIEQVTPRMITDKTVQRDDDRRTSLSRSSTVFVTGVKSATVTIGNSSSDSKGLSGIPNLITRPRRSAANSSIRRSHESGDSNVINPCGDQIVCQRAAQRRRILEELVESEENYVGDLKVLVNVYFTLLASVCALSSCTRDSIRENVTDILHMHEELLDNLRKTMHTSDSSVSRTTGSTPTSPWIGHIRWHSTDNAPTRARGSRLASKLRHSLDIVRPTKSTPIDPIADPQTVFAVAKLFNRFASQLLAYEEYGAKYEMMVRDLAATYKTLSTGQAFEKGIEVLSKTLDSINNREPHSKKGMTFGDLVIKPIQRVCRYPLIFDALCKNTPVSDGPEAHAALEKVRFRLKEANHQINEAKDDPKIRQLMETTWLLQDRLRFPNEMSMTVVHRVLGHLQLCGVLHVAYQSRLGMNGQYMLCALFKSCLILAVGEKNFCFYNVVASIPIASISLEESDSGKGLQCHTAPHSWKIIFESDHRLFEVLLSACSKVEEEQWRNHLTQQTRNESLDIMARDFCSLVDLDLKPTGTLYGQSYTLANRISIHRAATLGPKTQISHVIVKNTKSPDQICSMASEASLPLGRSHSMLSSSYVQVLAPRRSERMNLESALADVWTKDVLPFPGMKPVESGFRTSANHVMRKLSMASITSTLSKRTSSFVSSNKPETRAPTPIDFSLNIGKIREPKPRTRHAPQSPPPQIELEPTIKTVDFHKNPEAFLPPDFELKDPRRSKPQRLRPTIWAVERDRAYSAQLYSSQTDTVKPLSNSTANVSLQTKNENKDKAPGRFPIRVSSSVTNDENSKQTSVLKTSKLIKENMHSPSRSLQPITKQLRRLFN